ncbi:MAG: hypothetical protein FWD74_06345 [Actinomycetia bacterium]|nr:hypothetical protein [Actinomycetes bacterium]
MKVKERLHELVESMDDEQAASTLRLLDHDQDDQGGDDALDARELPTWVGAYRGPGDVVERMAHHLADGFGN